MNSASGIETSMNAGPSQWIALFWGNLSLIAIVICVDARSPTGATLVDRGFE